jgi:glycosyltransferase involved in cell wall biosynthesis
MKRQRIAIVVQRYGADVNGGAEVAARWLAERLQARHDVHVLSTCAVDFTTWANVYEEGESKLNGVVVHRFPVDHPRDWHQSPRDTARILHYQHTVADEIDWIRRQGPFSSKLIGYLYRHSGHFDAFFFFSYHYATTYFGLPLAAEKAVLVPTAHDDPYLSLAAYRAFLRLPRAFAFLTEPERQLVQRHVDLSDRPSIIAGIGIEEPPASAQRFREKYRLHDPFLLYVGRINASKNVPELLDHYLRYLQAVPAAPQLVLLGKSHLPLPAHPGIKALGFVPEQDKFDAMAAATLLIVPSLYESLSIVTLEAWALGVPVLVNGRCAVLKHQCRRANGGLYYTSFDEFVATTTLLLSNADLRQAMGQAGRQFVAAEYDASRITAQYERLLGLL